MNTQLSEFSLTELEPRMIELCYFQRPYSCLLILSRILAVVLLSCPGLLPLPSGHGIRFSRIVYVLLGACVRVLWKNPIPNRSYHLLYSRLDITLLALLCNLSTKYLSGVERHRRGTETGSTSPEGAR